ncbi:MAG: tandem-95 repeat protein [Candidatus Hydrogenedentota bacterium]
MGTVDVTVNMDGFGSRTRFGGYQYTSAYDIYSVNPGSGPLSGGQSIRLNGVFPSIANASSIYSVYFGGNQADFDTSIAPFFTANDIYVISPPGSSPGYVNVALFDTINDIYVTDSDYNPSYLYIDPFSISYLSPSDGPIGGGNTVTVLGSFPVSNTITSLAEANAYYSVLFDGNPGSFVPNEFGSIITASAMYVKPPPGAGLGTVDVTVNMDGFGSRTRFGGYQYTSAYDIYSVNPNSGFLEGGQTVRLNGAFPALANAASIYTVYFGDSPAAYQTSVSPFFTANDIYVISPPGTNPGTFDISIFETVSEIYSNILIASETYAYTYIENPSVPMISIFDSIHPNADLEMDFGTVSALAQLTQSVEIYSSGTEHLTISSIDLSNDPSAFDLSNLPVLPLVLNPGDSASFDLLLGDGQNPFLGTYLDSIAIMSNAYNAYSTQVALSVIGEAQGELLFTDSLVPEDDQEIDFGIVNIGGSIVESVTIENTGLAVSTIENIYVGGSEYRVDTFEDGSAENWYFDMPENWSVFNGVLQAQEIYSSGSAVALFQGDQYTDVSIELDWECDSTRESWGFVFVRATLDANADVDPDTGELLNVTGDFYRLALSTSGEFEIHKSLNGIVTKLGGGQIPEELNLGRNHLQAVVVGNQIELYLNGQPIASINDSILSAGYSGFGGTLNTSSDEKHYFDNVIIKDLAANPSTNPFSVTFPGSTPFGIADGTTVDLDVTFEPINSGSESGVLLIYSDDIERPVFPVEFRGRGNAAPIINQGSGPIEITIDEDETPSAWIPPSLSASDIDSTILTWSILVGNEPNHGTETVSGTGTSPTFFDYIPDPNWNGFDQFTVQVSDDDGATDVITIEVTVNPRNDAPTNTEVPWITGIGHVGRQLSASTGLWNDDTDQSPGNITYTFQWQRLEIDIQNDFDLLGVNVLDIPDATSSTYVQTLDDNGKYLRIKVMATDDGEGSPATQSTDAYSAYIFVDNAVPTIDQGSGPITVTIDEDETPLSWAPPTLSATDTDGDILAWTLVSGSGPDNGTATVSGSGSTPPTFNYTPDPDWNGIDRFTVQVSDGLGGAEAIEIEVTVTPRNDAPTIDQGPGPLEVTMDEDGAPGPWVPPILSASDIDSSTLSWSVLSASGPSNGIATVSGSGSAPPTFNYTPNPDWNGIDHFTVQVSDGDGGTDTVEIEVTVTPRNDAPVLMLLGDSSVGILFETTYLDPGTLALDEEDGDITEFVVARVYDFESLEFLGGFESIDTSVFSAYIIEFDVVDSGGANAPHISREVHVIDPNFVSSQIWVDYRNLQQGIGSVDRPFSTFQEGFIHLSEGGEIVVSAGDYSEAFILQKPLRVSAVGGEVRIGAPAPPTGILEVSLSPTEAVLSGAQWKLDTDSAWRDVGTITDVPIGTRNISFKSVTDWIQPNSVTVDISDGGTTFVEGAYVELTDEIRQMLISKAEVARLNFSDYDTNNDGVLTIDEWMAAGLGNVNFTILADGGSQVTMNTLLVTTGLTPSSLSTVYVDFGEGEVGDGNLESPLRTLNEALALVALDGSGVVTINGGGTSSETFTGAALINPAGTITLTRFNTGVVQIGVPGTPPDIAAHTFTYQTTDNNEYDSTNAIDVHTTPYLLSDDERAAELRAFSTAVFEAAIPITTDIDGNRLLAPDGTIAIRLRDYSGLDLQTLWAELHPDHGADKVAFEWISATGDNDARDIWVLFNPAASWRVADFLTALAGGTTLGGDAVQGEYISAKTEDTLDAHTVTVQPVTILNTDGTLTNAWQIGPDQVFREPTEVTIPVSAGIDLSTLRVMYYKPGEPNAGWHDAEDIIGLLVAQPTIRPDSITVYLRHGGVLALKD